MGRFLLKPGELSPNKIGGYTKTIAKNQLKITKNIALSNLKQTATNILVGKTDPAELLDPAHYTRYLGQDSKVVSGVATLLGLSDKRESPKYLTPWGSSATNYFVLRRKKITKTPTAVDTSYTPDVEAQFASPSVGQIIKENKGDTVSTSISEFVDLSALVSISQRKNIIKTQVTGRDMSRKEFISNGDYTITVSGSVYGQYSEQYPEEQVQILKEMLEAKEVLNVDCPLLNRFGINGLIILDFKLPQTKGSHNRQDYQITAIHEKPIEILQAEEIKKQGFIQEALKTINEWVAVDTLLTKNL